MAPTPPAGARPRTPAGAFVVDTADGRSTHREGHRAARHRELVDATLRAIRQHGAGAGMDEIAAAAGTSKTVFYRHFTDRAGLYDAVAERVDELVLRDLTHALGSGDGPLAEHDASPRAILGAAVDSYLRLVERDPEVHRFVVAAPLLTQGRLQVRTDAATDISRRVATQIAGLIADAMAAHGRDPAPAEIWAHAVVGMVRAAAEQWLATGAGDGAVTREDLAGYLTELIWSGLSDTMA